MSRSLRAATTVAALSLALVGGAAAAPAFAATAPVPGTSECTSAVNNTSAVQTARANLAQAQATVRNDRAAYDKAVSALNAQQDVVSRLTAALHTDITNNPIGGVTGVVNQAEVDQAAAAVPAKQQAVDDALATLHADQAKVATARNDLQSAITTQTTALCTGTVATPAPAPIDQHNVPATVSQGAIEDQVANLACTSPTEAVRHIDEEIAARQAANLPASDAVKALNDKLSALRCTGDSALTPQAAAQTAKDCGCVTTTVAEAPAETSTHVITSKRVVATQDDNSVATTSGTQVTDVPEGSASTGSA